ncbi:MAG: FHA domain-containing protein [Microcoleaceae cyanobacterium]
MKELTLVWIESGQPYSFKISQSPPSQNLSHIRIGRDPSRCDLVLSDPTVSGLHIEIFFNLESDQFCVRNLRNSNPPQIDGQSLMSGEMTLKPGSQLILGQLPLQVESIVNASLTVPPTLLISPDQIPNNEGIIHNTPIAQYGLRCQSCGRICSFNQLELSCQWCGTSLAAAESVVLSPDHPV